MKHKQRHSLFSALLAALLAVLVSVGLSVSAVQSSTMDITMDMSSSVGTMNSDKCGDCPTDDDDIAAGCTSICTTMAFATLPLSMDLERLLQGDRIEVSPVTPRDGPRSSEPNPPKRHDFS